MTYPALIENTEDDEVTTELTLRHPLPAHARVAVWLAAHQLRSHAYIVHKASEGQRITLLGYVQTTALGPWADATLRVPQRGAWLLCPSQGEVFVVPSDALLTLQEISTRLSGATASTIAFAPEAEASDLVEIEAAPPPVGGDKDA